MNETDSVQTQQDQADLTSPGALVEADVLIEADDLIEEVSIDGMCGVY